MSGRPYEVKDTMKRSAVSIDGGVEKDPEIAAALSWLVEIHDDRSQF